MLATLGDLLDDLVVTLGGPVNHAADTPARIRRRRGGSAANVAAAAAGLGATARFLGQVGTDPAAERLLADLASAGVDVAHVRRDGTTGTIVVLVDPSGERSMLTDRRACIGLDRPRRDWLTDVTMLHVPLYSLAEPPLSDTARRLIDWCRHDRIPVSIDLSSTTVITALGADAVRDLLDALHPAVVFANADEARHLAVDGRLGHAVTVVKRGAEGAVVWTEAGRQLVPAEPVAGVSDTTGAGDAFAAGFLVAGLDDPVAACRAGHRAAAGALRSNATVPDL